MESTMRGIRGDGAPCVLDMDDAATMCGGVGDTYGEDCATEERLVTPWTVSVARERETHHFRGLLPPAIISQELQERKIMHNIRQYQLPLQRYMAVMDLQEGNKRLFYKLLTENVEELLPVVWIHI